MKVKLNVTDEKGNTLIAQEMDIPKVLSETEFAKAREIMGFVVLNGMEHEGSTGHGYLCNMTAWLHDFANYEDSRYSTHRWERAQEEAKHCLKRLFGD